MEHILENLTPRCGANVQSDGSVRWLVWAPKADRVEVVLIQGDTRAIEPIRHFVQWPRIEVSSSPICVPLIHPLATFMCAGASHRVKTAISRTVAV